MRTILALGIAAVVACGTAHASPDAQPLVAAIQLDRIFNGVTTSEGGRVFVTFPRQDPAVGIEVGEIVAGVPHPYPDASWNAWQPDGNAEHAFVGANALRVGPDGDLWVVDRGSTGAGQPVVLGGAKLVDVDLVGNRVRRIYPLGMVASTKAFLDDVRFAGRHAYLTDAGEHPGIVVLDLDTGDARHVLTDDPTMFAHGPLMAEGKPLVDRDGKPWLLNADQLEISDDGQWFYYQPCSGPMSRIETRYLDDATLTDAQLALHVRPFAATRTTGGTAISATGTIYASDTNTSSILAISPTGKISTLIRDPRLAWVDAMWIDRAGDLWIPAAQLNRTPDKNHGVDAVEYPTTIYKLHIGEQPVPR